MPNASELKISNEETTALTYWIAHEKHLRAFLLGQTLTWMITGIVLEIFAADIASLIKGYLIWAFLITFIPFSLFWLLINYAEKKISAQGKSASKLVD